MFQLEICHTYCLNPFGYTVPNWDTVFQQLFSLCQFSFEVFSSFSLLGPALTPNLFLKLPLNCQNVLAQLGGLTGWGPTFIGETASNHHVMYICAIYSDSSTNTLVLIHSPFYSL